MTKKVKFPVEGTKLERCYSSVRPFRKYAHITFDLLRSDYRFTPDGSAKIGGICQAYIQDWIDRANRKEVPFPRQGVGYSTSPTEHVSLTVLREDAEDVMTRLWNVIWDFGHYGNIKHWGWAE